MENKRTFVEQVDEGTMLAFVREIEIATELNRSNNISFLNRVVAQKAPKL